jgi:adenine-specific DNA methylase
MIEKNFNVPFIASLALREKQIQQNYRPLIAVHKWFARRPGTLFRGLLLSEFLEKPLEDSFYESQDFSGITIADPFMGGGTPILEANRTGCHVVGYDINPMAWWIVKEEIEELDLLEYEKSALSLKDSLEKEIGQFYRTSCSLCSSEEARVKYFLWVKTKTCENCGSQVDLFPGYLLATDTRHPQNVFVCPYCGELTETRDRKNPGRCKTCSTKLLLEGPARKGKCTCPICNNDITFPDSKLGPPEHRLFAIEYYCSHCKATHKGRFFKKPDAQDIEKIKKIESLWGHMTPKYVPEEEIPSGDETNRLHRWGYKKYREMFSHRQLVSLELSARIIAKEPNKRIRDALATNLSDLLRYQNMLCRYDTKALKSLDIFSVHGFPVGLVQCESNFMGIMEPGSSLCIGSGGWTNIIEKFKKAKSFCTDPFEIKHQGNKKDVIFTRGEHIGTKNHDTAKKIDRKVTLFCKDAAFSPLKKGSLDAVFTDPPYFGNVQYAELMDFCYVWLRKIVGKTYPEFHPSSTRNTGELTANLDMGRGLKHFTEGISSVFQNMAGALKSGAPFVFTYHHNTIEAYYPIATAILNADLLCTATMPCPAEMSASIHINGTGSSIVDTVFICRSQNALREKPGKNLLEDITYLVEKDITELEAGKVPLTPGDVRCLLFGHITRLAIDSLLHTWDINTSLAERLSKVAHAMQTFGEPEAILQRILCNRKLKEKNAIQTETITVNNS